MVEGAWLEPGELCQQKDSAMLTAWPDSFLDEETGETVELPEGYSHITYATERFLAAKEREEAEADDKKRWQAYLVAELGDEERRVGAVTVRAVKRRVARFDPWDFWKNLPAEMTRDEMEETIKAGKSYDVKALPSVALEAYARATRTGESSAWIDVKEARVGPTDS